MRLRAGEAEVLHALASECFRRQRAGRAARPEPAVRLPDEITPPLTTAMDRGHHKPSAFQGDGHEKHARRHVPVSLR